MKDDNEVPCPVCDGAIKWHKDGKLCNMPIRMLMGVICKLEHTFCMLCERRGTVTDVIVPPGTL